MTKIEVIEREIESLPEQDFKKLRKWFSDKDWEKWDREIEADSAAGKLAFLVSEAGQAKKYGRLENL